MEKKVNKVRNKCHDCGGLKVTSSIGPYKMPLAGGKWFATIEGAELTYCPDCGGHGVGFQKLGPMMRAIAAAVVRKPTRLAPEEIRFLRDHLGYTGRDLARLLGVGPSSVSRWENGKEPIGPVPDRLLRTLEVLRDGVEGFDVQALGTIGDEAGAPMRLRVRMKDGQWRAAA
jgi:putative transcriptional regulator